MPSINETQIAALLDNFAEAVHTRNLERVMSCYSRDLVEFDVTPPLKASVNDARKAWQMCFEMSMGPVGYEIRDRQIAARDDLGVAFGLLHFTTMNRPDRKKMDMWMRWTAAFRKVNGEWKIVHEHDSFPIDMTTDKAVTNLRPNG